MEKRRSKKQERIDLYKIEKVIEAAIEARLEASPITSKYHVGAAALWKNGIITRGWNIEYGGKNFGEAGMRCVHAEQHMVVNAKKDTRRGSMTYLAVIGGNSDDPQAPCGDCREVIKTYSDGETRIIIRKDGNDRSTRIGDLQAPCGDRRETIKTYSDESTQIIIYEDGKEDHLHAIDDLLPNKFRHERIADMPSVEQDTIKRFFPSGGVPGFVGLSELMCEELNEDLDIAFCVARFSDRFVEGFQMDDPAFHQVSAVGSALSRAWTCDGKIESLHVFSTLGRVDGRDRQFIYNYASRHGIEKTLPVYICKIGAHKPGRVMRTTPSELLPFAFGVSYIERDDADYGGKR